MTRLHRTTVVTALLMALIAFAPPGHASVAEKLRDGCRLLTGGRWQPAAKAFRDAAAEDATCVEALVGEGTAHLLGGFQEAASGCFDRALILDGADPAAHVGKATAAYLARRYDEALENYRYALSYEGPQRASIRASEAQVACFLGLYDVAGTEAQLALTEQPGLELALQVLAATLIARNRPAEALEALSLPLPAVPQTLGVVACSPLYSAGARYAIDNRLDDGLRLAYLKNGLAPAPTPPPAAGTSEPATPTPAYFSRGDNTFNIGWPKPGARLTGRSEVNILCEREAGVQYVAVLIDEQFSGMTNSTPFRVYVDSTLARDGLREIRVDGYGADGTIVKTASIMVNVANAQRTLSEGERATRAGVGEFLQSLLILRAHPLLRAQLVGHALEAQGRLQEAIDAYEYAFSYECTLPCIRGDLLLAYRKLGLSNAVQQHEIHSLPRTQTVALTFDDGPHPILTPWILDLLDRYNAKATFLLVGKQVEMYPELTREILRRGHEIGSHSYTHSNLRQISQLGVERELVMSRQVIRRACGEFVTLFRPPGGNYDPQVREAVTQTGFSTVFWNENITSYPGQTGDQILPNMLRKLDQGGIVLLHNGFDETREVLPLLLPALAQRGLKMDTVSALTTHRPFRVERPLTSPLEWNL